MKKVQLLSVFFIIAALIFSCKTDEQKREEKENAVLENLPGNWDIREIKIKAIDDVYTKRAGIFKDTILTNFGTLEVKQFAFGTTPINVSTFTSSVEMKVGDSTVRSRIQSLICTSGCTINLHQRSIFNLSKPTHVFIDNLFILNHSYKVHFINDDLVELEAHGNRAIETILLERR